ncbi:hypothetical protein EYF80_009540 [Liparis tanakae]|uniref:Uncharacterized protein n=1 Tax=Liparis tanakae TaxID=230148 RepID=A0A4Z2IQM4_9TELE|nr:hypothetical protein EYF80_009540 [Liparis tanakae]
MEIREPPTTFALTLKGTAHCANIWSISWILCISGHRDTLGQEEDSPEEQNSTGCSSSSSPRATPGAKGRRRKWRRRKKGRREVKEMDEERRDEGEVKPLHPPGHLDIMAFSCHHHHRYKQQQELSGVPAKSGRGTAHQRLAAISRGPHVSNSGLG